MKKYLLPNQGNCYKANLHCHTDLSDGALTPAQVKEEYKKRGYSIVAYTDHDVMIPHPELNDEEFLALNGYEMEIFEPGEGVLMHRRTCHMCLVALEPDNLKQVCYHREKYLFGNAVNQRDKIDFYRDEPDYERSYDAECVSDMMKQGREHGFFVTYNHPTWSGEGYDMYMNFHHMHAMEIWNSGCNTEGHDEYNPRVYADMLRGGKRIYCIGADDNHGTKEIGKAWIVVKADKLEYRTITKALEEGNFYSSEGPEIKALWVEDGVIHVECSDAAMIRFSYVDRRINTFRAEEGKMLNEASVELYPLSGYVRVTIEDAQGRRAESNAYFLDEFME